MGYNLFNNTNIINNSGVVKFIVNIFSINTFVVKYLYAIIVSSGEP